MILAVIVVKEFEGVTNTDEAFAQFCLQVKTHIFAKIILLYLKKRVTYSFVWITSHYSPEYRTILSHKNPPEFVPHPTFHSSHTDYISVQLKIVEIHSFII